MKMWLTDFFKKTWLRLSLKSINIYNYEKIHNRRELISQLNFINCELGND